MCVYTWLVAFTRHSQNCKPMPTFKLQPVSGRYCTLCLALLCSFVIPKLTAFGQQKVTLREKYQEGELYVVEANTAQSGVLDTVPDARQPNLPKRLSRTGKAKSQYLEKVLSVDVDQLANKTIRKYLILEAEQKIDNVSTQAKLRPQLQFVVLDRKGSQAVTFSPDGPMLLGELEQVRTDVFLPRLTGLLPKENVVPGTSWKATNEAVQELTDLQKIDSGSLNSVFSQMEAPDIALVKFNGQVTGATPTGSNQQTIQGSYRFDLKAQRMVALKFEVTSILMDRDRKRVGDISAIYQMTRKPAPGQILATTGMVLEVNEENTLLLVQEPRLGLEMVHSRRWVPRPVNDKSWIIDGPSGSGLTIQFESANAIPQAEAVRKPIEATLGKTAQNLKPLPDPAGWTDVPRLSWTGAQNGKEYVFEYFLWKQGSKGAIIAGRYFAPEANLAQKDVERMIKGLRVGP